MLNKYSIGDLIVFVDERNTERKVDDFFGININKEFMPTVANTDTVDAKKYKIVRYNRFVFSGMQTGRDECIRIGLYQKEKPIIVSPAYTTFEISRKDIVLEEYFFMFFLRKEMDRYGWFISDSSVRANLDLERFCEISITLPSLTVQRKYANLFAAVVRCDRLKNRIKDICPILIKGSLEEAKKSQRGIYRD